MPEGYCLLTSEEIKERELNLLTVFDAFCRENHLRYSLCGGSLLGAIRHKGFIPWDDDIDVLMPRPDYDAFFRLAKEKKAFKTGNFSDCTSPCPFVRLFDADTIVEREYSATTDAAHLWIDVFPMDGLPADDEELARLFKKSRFLRHMLVFSDARFGTGASFKSRVVKMLSYLPTRLVGRYRWAAMIDKNARTLAWDSGDYVGGLAWGYGPCERVLRSEAETYVDIPFEGRTFKAFSCWDTYLSQLYGDYMVPPPEGKRGNHKMKVWGRIHEA